MSRSSGDSHGLDQTAIGKAALVVQALAETRRLSDVARLTDLPVSTVHRILHQLVQIGWAREDGDRGYLLGARLLWLVSRASDDRVLTRVAGPVLEQLRDRTRHAVHLATRQGDEAVYIDKLEGWRPYYMRSRVGLSVPLHCTAIGKALLAQLSSAAVTGIAERTGLRQRTPHTIDSLPRLLEQLTVVRDRGFAVDDEENETEIRCIGAAVLDHRELPIGGVSISSLAYEFDEDSVQRNAPLVVGAAQAISQLLGSRSSGAA